VSYQNVKWDEAGKPDGVNEYMELLVKETVTLHKVLSRYLTMQVVEVRGPLPARIQHAADLAPRSTSCPRCSRR
jgi:vacuolar protein sorting-associated protein 54